MMEKEKEKKKIYIYIYGFLGGSAVEESTCQAGNLGLMAWQAMSPWGCERVRYKLAATQPPPLTVKSTCSAGFT